MAEHQDLLHARRRDRSSRKPSKPETKIPGSRIAINLHVNGDAHRLEVEARLTLLEALRERLGLTGTKKSCDRGECGACTVHLDGKRALSCMTLAVLADGRRVTTIEGLARDGTLHPVQAAFIEHDAFQCGFCTPGQIMSAVACIREGHAGSAEEIREYMSGNICRCSAYQQIVSAIQTAAARAEEAATAREEATGD